MRDVTVNKTLLKSLGYNNHIVLIDSSDNWATIGDTTLLDGLDISNGDATNNGQMILHGTYISNNIGGGIYVIDGTVYIRNCMLKNNFASQGSAIGISYIGGASIIDECIITDNLSSNGGPAISLLGPSSVIRNNTLENCITVKLPVRSSNG